MKSDRVTCPQCASGGTMNAAAQQGWRVLRFSGRDIKSGEALIQIKRALTGG